MNINKNSKTIVFFLFAISIFAKCIIFHYSCFGYVAVSSLWHAPAEFMAFYASKLFPAVFIASFVFLSRRYWWTIVATIIIDLWIIANIIYYRANDLFINADAISIVDNMTGFWSSIWLYVNWECVFIFIVSVITIIFALILKSNNERRWHLWSITLGSAVLFYFINATFGVDYDMKNTPRPGSWPKYKGMFVAPRYAAAGYYALWESWYIEGSSVLQYAVAEGAFVINKIALGEPEIHFSDDDYKQINQLTSEDSMGKNVVPTTNLVLVIVESLESWPVGLVDVNNVSVAPNLDRIIGGKCLYCPNIKSQVLQGTSGDGQMIINTGLLPIQPGAACVKYGTNKFPSFAHLYRNGGVIYPNNAWNQIVVSKSYGYKFSKKPNPSTNKDEIVFGMLGSYIDTASSPYCVQAITISMHGPFDRVDCHALSFEKDAPSNLFKYLNCLHYTDSCIGDFLQKIEQDSLLANTTIVITGDHTVFKSSMLREFQPFAEKYNYPIPSEESYCPLIIYSPTIKERTVVDELCYQMDIFPIILHCIGADDYYWKGFGVNLLDSTARHNRKITEDEAYILSDKMIRSDWFRNKVIKE